MIGVGYGSCTAFHLAEYRYTPSRRGRPTRASSRERRAALDVLPGCGPRRQGIREYRQNIEEQTVVRQGYVGNAECRLMSFRGTVNFAAEWMARNRKLTPPNRVNDLCKSNTSHIVIAPTQCRHCRRGGGGWVDGSTGPELPLTMAISPGPLPMTGRSSSSATRTAPGEQRSSRPGPVDSSALRGPLRAHRPLTDLPPGSKAGFMDRELQQGKEWPWRLSKPWRPAVSSSRCIRGGISRASIAARSGSPSTGARSTRGRERRRSCRDDRSRALDSDARRPAPRGGALGAVSAGEFGPLYAEHGFYGIMKVNRCRDDYDEAVYLLARRMVDVAEASPVEPGSRSSTSRCRPRSAAARDMPGRQAAADHRRRAAAG